MSKIEKLLDDFGVAAMLHGAHPDEYNEHRDEMESLKAKILFSFRVQKVFPAPHGFVIVADPSVPRDRIELRTPQGHIVGVLTGAYTDE